MPDRPPVPRWLRLLAVGAGLILSLLTVLQLTGWDTPSAVATRLESQQVTAETLLRRVIIDSTHALRSDLGATAVRVDSLGITVAAATSQLGDLRTMVETQLAITCLNTNARDLALARAPCDRILLRRGVSR